MRSKPILSPEDIKERYAWAKKYRAKSAAWWLRTVHIHLDNHTFKRAATGYGRKLLAKRRVRGVYRTKNRGLRSSHVKPNTKLRSGLPKGIWFLGNKECLKPRVASGTPWSYQRNGWKLR